MTIINKDYNNLSKSVEEGAGQIITNKKCPSDFTAKRLSIWFEFLMNKLEKVY